MGETQVREAPYRLSDFEYDLPDRFIARHPTERRDHSRLLVVDPVRKSFADRHFYDLPEFLQPGDLLVLNSTRVLPARLMATRRATGAAIEIFLLERDSGAENIWRVLAAPARKVKIGETLDFGHGLHAEVIEESEEGGRTLRFSLWGSAFENILEEIGEVPLPPYLHRAASESDKERYQTVYADVPGAVAAPTAGLHFTPELLRQIEASGVRIASIILHTGLGTFRPVQQEDLSAHVMHEEYYHMSGEAAALINETRREGGRILAVGTTTVRTLETVASDEGFFHESSGRSSLFIRPPYTFKTPLSLLTNFHMPRSTLLMMISALIGRDFLLECYEHAKREDYRFFSYGDAMLILDAA